MDQKQRLRGNTMMLIVLAVAAVLVGVRVGCAFLFLGDSNADFFANMYIVIGLAIGLIGLWVTSLVVRPNPKTEPSVFPVALTAGLFGLSLIIGNGFDAVMWLAFHQLPAPLEKSINLTDTLMLAGSLLFGILAGIYFIRIALIWIAENQFYIGVFRISALTPILWIWLRIARYELAHAGLVDITFSVYDFLFFVFAMLFLFRFAGAASDVGRKRLPSLRFFAAAAALCGLSDTMVRFAMYLTNDAQLYQSTQLVTGVDFCLGLFALAMVWFLWNGGLNTPPVDKPSEHRAERIPDANEIHLILGDAPSTQHHRQPIEIDTDAAETVSKMIDETIDNEPCPVEKECVVEEMVENTEDILETIKTIEPAKVEATLSVDDILNDILSAREQK